MAKILSVDDTLLGTSAVYLFGRLLSDVKVVTGEDAEDENRPPRKGKNNFLKDQLRDDEAGFARIFAFSFEGAFCELTRPSVFLVHGAGLDPDAPAPGDDYKRLARSPGRVTRTGVGRHFGAFAMDLRVWVYDKGDFSMRLDVETGTLDQILLEAEIGADDPAHLGGFGRSSGGRSSGGRSSGGRSSGAMGRSSGWMPRGFSDD